MTTSTLDTDAPAAMAADTAIGQIDELARQINHIAAGLAAEASRLTEQWAQLRRVGGQRADHAARMLATLRPHVHDLAELATAATTQLDGAIANPFGDD